MGLRGERDITFPLIPMVLTGNRALDWLWLYIGKIIIKSNSKHSYIIQLTAGILAFNGML